MTDIKSSENELYIEESGEVIARIHFFPSGKDINGRDLIIVDHTIVTRRTQWSGIRKKIST